MWEGILRKTIPLQSAKIGIEQESSTDAKTVVVLG
jgi:hypothetical protein